MMMIILSVTLVIAALALRWFQGDRAWVRGLLSAAVVIIALMSIGYALIHQITGAGINNATFYHMATGLHGGDITEYAGSLVLAAVALVLAFGIAGIVWRYWDNATIENPKAELAVLGLLGLSFVLHPLVRDITSHFTRGFTAQQTADLGGQGQFQAKGDQKNLILLYVESFERTYFDQTVFPGLATNLAALEAEAVSFPNITQAIGGDFTVGGMVSSQCGVPLILPSGSNSMTLENFIPGANCLGDILADNGYKTEYLGGSSLEFAGKGAFYNTHSYDSVLGLKQLFPTLEDQTYLGPWGLQDDTLYGLAHQRLAALADQDQPFALTMLTLDTHHPSGHADTNRACLEMDLPRDGNMMADSVICADRMAMDFIRQVQDSPLGDDTMIVVMSDHTAMVNDLTPRMKGMDRTNMFFVLDPDSAPQQVADRHGTTLDAGPTILSMMGFDAPDLGFGVNLLGDAPTLVEANEKIGKPTDWTDAYFAQFKDQLDGLWALPSLNAQIAVRQADRTIKIEDTVVEFPFVSKVNASGHLAELSIFYQNTDRDRIVYLGSIVDKMDAGEKILWIDECKILRHMAPDQKFGTAPYCVLAGQIGADTLRVDRLGTDMTDIADFLLTTTTDDISVADLHQTRLDNMLTYVGSKPHEFTVATSDFDATPRYLRSAAMGLRTSGLFAPTGAGQTTGPRRPLRRGVNIVGLTKDGDWETFLIHDQCDASAQNTDRAAAVQTLQQGLQQYEFVAVAVDDSAWCDPNKRDFTFIEDTLGLKTLSDLPMRRAYFGLVERNGRVRELTGLEDETLFVRLVPQIDPALPTLADQQVASIQIAPQRRAVVPKQTTVFDMNELVANAHDGTCTAPQIMPARSYLSDPIPLDVALRLDETPIEGFVNFDNGWWEPEDAGRWIGKSVAHMEFILPASDDGLTLDLKFDVFSANARSVRVTFDGTLLHDGLIDDDGNMAIDVSALPRQTLAQLRFEFDTPVFDCPAHRFGNQDSRQLAVMLWSIALSERDQTQVADTAREGLPAIGDVIALAGGALGAKTGTNSLDALWENRERYDYFEIDLSFTFDGQLVCLLDWEQAFVDRFGFEALETLSHRTFVELLNKVDLPGPTNCTLHTLAGWLYKNNDKRIITEFANDDIASLHELAATLPSLKERFVVKLSDVAAVEAAKELGFTDVIFDMAQNEDLLSDAPQNPVFDTVGAFSLSGSQIEGGWAPHLKSADGDVQVYADTAGSADVAKCYMAQGVDAVFAHDVTASDLTEAGPVSADCTSM